MWSSGILRRVALVRTDVSYESIATIIRVIRPCEQRSTLEITSNRSTLKINAYLLVIFNVVLSSAILVTLMMGAICSSETSVLVRTKRHNITEDGIVDMSRGAEQALTCCGDRVLTLWF
jgi:hypothetical protein